MKLRKRFYCGEAVKSDCVYVKVAPQDVGMFRFLLEAYDNTALFTVLDKYAAILKVFYSPHQAKEVIEILNDMTSVIAIGRVEID